MNALAQAPSEEEAAPPAPKQRQKSRSRSAAPVAEELKARPSRGRPQWVPKPSEAPRTQSETAKPKPSTAPRKREESIETVPATSVPPRAKSQPAAEAEEEKPKPQRAKRPTKEQMGKMAEALRERMQTTRAVRNMQVKQDKQLRDAKNKGQAKARAEPPMPAILPIADEQDAVAPVTPSRRRSASAPKGKKHEKAPSPAKEPTAKKARESTGSTTRKGQNHPHREKIPVNALLTGQGKPKAKGRPKKATLESIPETTPAPIKRGRGRPKKVVVVANRIGVPNPVMPYNDVGNDPFLIKSH